MTDRLNQIQRLSAFFRFSDELLKLVLVIVEHKRNSRKNNEKYMEWVRSGLNRLLNYGRGLNSNEITKSVSNWTKFFHAHVPIGVA